ENGAGRGIRECRSVGHHGGAGAQGAQGTIGGGRVAVAVDGTGGAGSVIDSEEGVGAAAGTLENLPSGSGVVALGRAETEGCRVEEERTGAAEGIGSGAGEPRQQ